MSAFFSPRVALHAFDGPRLYLQNCKINAQAGCRSPLVRASTRGLAARPDVCDRMRATFIWQPAVQLSGPGVHVCTTPGARLRLSEVLSYLTTRSAFTAAAASTAVTVGTRSL